MSVLHGGDGRLVWELFTTALQFPTRSGTRRGARAKVVWTLQALLAVPVGMPWASTYVVTNIVTSDITCGGRAHFTRACSMFRFWFVSACGVAIRVGTQKSACAQRVLFNLHRKLVHSGERLQTLGLRALTLRSFFCLQRHKTTLAETF